MLDVSVGGHITAGDDSLATAVKETREELGLQVSADELKVRTLPIF
jgi:isopentenyl-diphosphate delta-isomerase